MLLLHENRESCNWAEVKGLPLLLFRQVRVRINWQFLVVWVGVFNPFFLENENKIEITIKPISYVLIIRTV